MGTIIVKNAVEREKGFMYYIDKTGNLCKSKMVHGKKSATKKVAKKTATTKKKKR